MKKQTFLVPQLEQVLTYQNEQVIDSFLKSFRILRRDARQLFQDVLRLLWLHARGSHLKKKFVLEIYSFHAMLDEMWHSFLLFTKDYEEFCVKHFGRLIHHYPTNKKEKKLSTKEQEKRLGRFIELVFDELGEPCANRLFARYPTKYTPEFMDAARVPYSKQRK